MVHIELVVAQLGQRHSVTCSPTVDHDRSARLYVLKYHVHKSFLHSIKHHLQKHLIDISSFQYAADPLSISSCCSVNIFPLPKSLLSLKSTIFLLHLYYSLVRNGRALSNKYLYRNCTSLSRCSCSKFQNPPLLRLCFSPLLESYMIVRLC